MFSRKNIDSTPTLIELKTTSEISKLFENNYKEECKKSNLTFYSRVEVYPDELLFILSLVHKTDNIIIPTTLFLSRDIGPKSDANKMLDGLSEAASIFFDNYFLNIEADHYIHEWDEGDFGKETLFYKVTRENIALSLEAERLLKNS